MHDVLTIGVCKELYVEGKMDELGSGLLNINPKCMLKVQALSLDTDLSWTCTYSFALLIRASVDLASWV